jgi:hypothetical protein
MATLTLRVTISIPVDNVNINRNAEMENIRANIQDLLDYRGGKVERVRVKSIKE